MFPPSSTHEPSFTYPPAPKFEEDQDLKHSLPLPECTHIAQHTGDLLMVNLSYLLSYNLFSLIGKLQLLSSAFFSLLSSHSCYVLDTRAAGNGLIYVNFIYLLQKGLGFC